jgi:NAD(P) transhydrogenase subunit alpha
VAAGPGPTCDRKGGPVSEEENEAKTPEGVRPLKVAALREGGEEARVALVPDAVGRLKALGIEVLIESGAGAAAWFPDEAYVHAGAVVLDAMACMERADVIVTVTDIPDERRKAFRPGQVLVGMLQPLVRPERAADLARLGVTAVSLDLLPRQLSRAQAMDALSSQANVAGYKAVLLAANAFPRYFPMLVTAAGTAKPAEVLVLGAGVAGLQAMGTARRLGAVVTGYDVRPETRAEIESVGARFLELRSVGPASGEGGYARALTAEEAAAQQDELNSHVARFDVVITTAQVPGRRPPLLVTAAALKQMRPGSVIVDLAASELGGNVEVSQPGQEVTTEGGVRVIGAPNLPATVPSAASSAFANNVVALLRTLVHDGEIVFDPDDEVHRSVLVARDGTLVHAGVRAAYESATKEAAR